MVAVHLGGGELSLWFSLLCSLCLFLSLTHAHSVDCCHVVFPPPPVLQRHLLWMLPLEVWQQVLGFCPCPVYARLVRNPSNREFYHLLKQSLLELHFGSMLPSPALGGLWMASRHPEAARPRILHLGSRFLPLCPFLSFFPL